MSGKLLLGETLHVQVHLERYQSQSSIDSLSQFLMVQKVHLQPCARGKSLRTDVSMYIHNEV